MSSFSLPQKGVGIGGGGGDKVSMVTYTYQQTPEEDLKWPGQQPTLSNGLMSDLVICKFRKSMGIHDTECPSWDQVSLNNTNQTKPPFLTSCLSPENIPIVPVW